MHRPPPARQVCRRQRPGCDRCPGPGWPALSGRRHRRSDRRLT